MKKILIAFLACFMLIGCQSKKVYKQEEVKKYVCKDLFTEDAWYTYSIDYEGEHVIFTENHYWSLEGWEYNKKNYEKLMASDSALLSKVPGVTVTYTADGENKLYTSQTVIDMDLFDDAAYFKKDNFFHNPYFRKYLDDWLASDDPDYHKEALRAALSAGTHITCE